MDKTKLEFLRAAIECTDTERRSPDSYNDMVFAAQAVAAKYPEYNGKVTFKKLFEELAPERHKELCDQIEAARTAYYDSPAGPFMSDEEYDALMHELRDIEEIVPSLKTANSPTQTVGGGNTQTGRRKVKHEPNPMLSLEDISSRAQVNAFVEKSPDGTKFTVEKKIDGLSVSLEYVNGMFTRGLLRGNGYIGEDITENARNLNGVPMRLRGTFGEKYPRLIVRGEVYLPNDDFLRLNVVNESTGGRIFKNPRNAASGIFIGKDPNMVRKAGLRIKVFNVQYAEPAMQCDHADSLIFLREMGFEIVDFTVCSTASEVWDAIEHIAAIRNTLPYWIDGAVVKVDSIALRAKLGNTTSKPNWAVAFKYPPDKKNTIIGSITLQTGRTGKVTPVAEFDPPVELGGTTVSRASVHNQFTINNLGLNIGDTVTVQKAQEIIPEIVKVVEKGDFAKAKMDAGMSGNYDLSGQVCPSCGSKLESEDGNLFYCRNPHCPAQKSRAFEFFCSRDVMDIRGLGPNQIQKFIDLGWLNTLPDIYRLKDHAEEMASLEGFGEKAVNNLLAAIEASKQKDIPSLIKGFGMPGIGNHVGKALAQRYSGLLSEICKLTEAEFASVEGVGAIGAKTLADFFDDPENIAMIEEFRDLGVNVASLSYTDKSETKGNVLSGMTFVITGTLSEPRSRFEQLIAANGGKVAGSVSKKTSYLLAGENCGSKLDKANALGVKVISEQEFYAMLN